MTKQRILSLWIVCLACAARLALSQNVSAELRGAIRDPSGATIPNASISAKNGATGITRTTASNTVGIFNFPNLQPAEYEITVSASGFASQLLTGVEPNVSAPSVLDITLTPSSVELTVEVKTDMAGIELTNAGLGGVEGARAIRELPLNGRDWTQLSLMQPGVSAIRTQNNLNGSSSNRASRGFGSAVSIGGGRPTQNNYFFDGISQNDYTNGVPGNALGLALGIDAIQEFSVLTNSYSAAYGAASGGVVNAASRSGTNGFHGSIYEYLRNDKLDARNFFDGPKPPFRRNQFGATAGGAIRRSKSFFFANYEGLEQDLTSTSIASVPSPAARVGNLSNGTITVSPAIVPYLALWPLPNGTLQGSGDTGQYIFTANSSSAENSGLVRIDHSFSTNDSVAFSWSTDKGHTETPDGLNTIMVGNSLWRNSVAINQTHIFDPQVINVFRAGMNHVTALGLSTSPGGNPAAFDHSLGVLPGRDAPSLTVPGITSFSGGNNGLATTNFRFTNLQFYDDVSIQKGRHAIKAGGNFVRYRYNTQVAATPNGGYEFPTLRDFLSNGQLSTFNVDVYFPGVQAAPTGTGFPERGFRQNVTGIYVQDDFRLKSNLTVNLGLRYEMASVPTEVHGFLSNLRDIYSTDLNIGEPLFQNPTWWNFEPRIGLAWDPFRNGKTSVRAGFGIFDVLPLIYEYSMIEAYSAPFSSVVSILNPPPGSFPDGGYQAILTLNSSNAPTRAPSIEYSPSRNYVMQWNASIERALTSNLALMAAYAGSRGVHMFTVGSDINIVMPAYTEQGYLFPSPVGSGTRLNPSFGSIRQLTWGDSSNYNSLQIRLRKKFSYGFQAQGAFTWQKSIDGYSSSVFPTQFQNSVTSLFIDRHLNRGPSDFSIGRAGVFDAIWELPKVTNGSPVLRALARDWEMGGIFTVSDGSPFTPLISGDATGQNSSVTYAVPNRVVGDACTHLINRGNPSQYINLACYSFPSPANLLGNAGRNSLTGPGLVELDFFVKRTFPLRSISETAQLQFRAEAFNLLNRTNFAPPLPNNRLYNARGGPLGNAGVITSTATTSRQIQLGLRLIW